MLPGFLQVTDATTNQAGALLYNRPIPATAGVVATFDQWQYSSQAAPADGVSFFVVDGATQLTMTGGAGGSLGYAQHVSSPAPNTPGIRGGYLGLGLDVLRELLQRPGKPRPGDVR